MYFNQATKHPDNVELTKAFIREVRLNCDKKHWNINPKEDSPKGNPVLYLVLAKNHKRDTKIRSVYKWKARLNAHSKRNNMDATTWKLTHP